MNESEGEATDEVDAANNESEEAVEDLKPEEESEEIYNEKDLDKDAEIAAQVEMIIDGDHKK